MDMKEYSGLKSLKSVSGNGVYCPKCGNYLEVVMNGFFHGDLFFCKKENIIFAVTLKDITAKAGKEYLDQCIADIEIVDLRYKITRNNLPEVKKLLSSLNK